METEIILDHFALTLSGVFVGAMAFVMGRRFVGYTLPLAAVLLPAIVVLFFASFPTTAVGLALGDGVSMEHLTNLILNRSIFLLWVMLTYVLCRSLWRHRNAH